jgi:hypothetical protein
MEEEAKVGGQDNRAKQNNIKEAVAKKNSEENN